MTISITIPASDIVIDVSNWHVEKWRNSRQLYDDCEALLIDIPDKCGGVYFFYNKDELWYVGRSINMRRRITDHLVKATNSANYINDVDRIECVKVDVFLDQEIYEIYAIKTLKPRFNKTKSTISPARERS